MKYLLRNKIFLLLLVVLLYFSPTAISLPQQSRSENIITAMGVDKTEQGYEVHIQYVLPYLDSNNSTLKVMTGKGSSVSEAVENLDMEYGKISGFAHCRTLIFNDKACEDDLTQILDYVVRIKTNTNNVTLINTHKSSKDVLECATNLDNELYTIINSNGIAGEQRKYQDLKTINDYYNCMFGDCKSIAISVINTEEPEKEQQDGGPSSSNGGEQASSNSASSSEKKIKNHGEIAIIKNGKKVLELGEEETDNLTWFDKDIREGKIIVENFSDELYKDATLNFFVINKKNKVNVSFKNGEPHFNLSIKVLSRLTQVIQDDMGENIYHVVEKKYSDKLVSAIKERITSQLVSAENNFKQNKYDIIECGEYFHKFCPKEYKDFLSKLENKDDFITHVHFSYNIDIEQRR